MSSRAIACLLLLSLCPAPAIAQALAAQPRVAILTGFGNAFGGIGAAGEAYVVGGRFSVFAGLGIWPGNSTFQTFRARAAGVRFYVPLARWGHRLFGEASVSVLGIRQAAFVGAPTSHDYGPGLSVGYSYLARSGFTLTAGAGAGRVYDTIVPLLHVGLGWTWH